LRDLARGAKWAGLVRGCWARLAGGNGWGKRSVPRCRGPTSANGRERDRAGWGGAPPPRAHWCAWPREQDKAPKQAKPPRTKRASAPWTPRPWSSPRPTRPCVPWTWSRRWRPRGSGSPPAARARGDAVRRHHPRGHDQGEGGAVRRARPGAIHGRQSRRLTRTFEPRRRDPARAGFFAH
jgi:hypothetical protein